MKFNTLHLIFFSCLLALLALSSGCASQDNPDEARRKAAEDTAKVKEEAKKATVQLKQDTKAAGQDLSAMAQGVREGWNQDKSPIDVNSATRAQLQTLPGIDAHLARRIIASRPYRETHELVTKNIVSEDEYKEIQQRIEVK